MLSDDVRALIRQVEQGNPFDREWAGHAYDVREEMRGALAGRLHTTALADEITDRIDRFARQSASTNMYLRLVIDDRAPDLPDYDPCNIAVFDGTQDSGTDFSKVIQRSTIYGTVMTSVNITDLRAYFESGRKRQLLMYMGSDRDADIKALDKMLGALPGLMANAGLDAGTIGAVVEQIRAGGMTPEILKLVATIARAAELRAQPQTPDVKAAIDALGRDFTAVMERALPGLPPVFARAIAALAASPAVLGPVLPPAVLRSLQDIVKATPAPASVDAPRADGTRTAEQTQSQPQRTQAPSDLKGQGRLDAALRTDTPPASSLRAGFARLAAIPAILNVPRMIFAAPPAFMQARAQAPAAKAEKGTGMRGNLVATAGEKIVSSLRAGFARLAAIPAVLNVPRIVLATSLRFGMTRGQDASIRADKAPAMKPGALAATFARPAARPAVMQVQRLVLATPLRFESAKAERAVPARATPVDTKTTTGLATRFSHPAVPTGLRVAPQPFTAPIRFAAAPHAGSSAHARMHAMLAVPLAAAAIATATVPAAASVMTRSGAGPVVASRLETDFTPREAAAPAPRRAAPAPANESVRESAPRHVPVTVASAGVARPVPASAAAPGQKTANAPVAATPLSETGAKIVSTPSKPAEAPTVQHQDKTVSTVAPPAAADKGTGAVAAQAGRDGNAPQIPQNQQAGTAAADVQGAQGQGQEKVQGQATPQYDENGKLKACCVGQFGEAAALKNAVAEARAAHLVSGQPSGDNAAHVAPTRYEAVNTGTGDIVIVDNGTGEKTLITRQEVDRNIQDHARLDAELRAAAAAKPDGPVTWQDDTAEMLRRMAQPTSQEKDQKMNNYFNHTCGAGCNHGHDHNHGFKAEAVGPSGQDVSNRGLDVTVVQAAKAPETEGKKTGSRPRRTLKIA